MNVTMVDWVIVGVVVVSMLISLRRGFVKEALSLVTWIASIVIARLFAGQVAGLLEDHIEVPSMRMGAAYIMLVVGTLLVGATLNNVVSELVRLTGLGGLDRLLGCVFGMARGFLVLLVVVAGLYYLAPVKEDAWWRESLLIPYLVETIEVFGPMVIDQGEQLVGG